MFYYCSKSNKEKVNFLFPKSMRKQPFEKKRQNSTKMNKIVIAFLLIMIKYSIRVITVRLDN